MRVTILFFRVISLNGDTIINTVENHVTRRFKFLFRFNFYRLFYFFITECAIWIATCDVSVNVKIISISVLEEKSYFTILIYLHDIYLFFFLFYSIPFRFIPFHSIPFRFVQLHSVSFHSIPFHSIPIHSISFPITYGKWRCKQSIWNRCLLRKLLIFEIKTYLTINIRSQADN